jgi:hypothetical protein
VSEQTQSAIRLLEALTERAKELTCLYAIEETLKEPDADIDQVCNRIIESIPPGWQFPDTCVATITLEGKEYRSQGFEETPWKLAADIVQQDQNVGTIGVYYTREMPAAEVGPFLNEERKLIETIADRISHFLTYRKMKHVFQQWRRADRDLSESRGRDWEAVLDLIRQTDNALFLRLSNKMLNHLCWSGIEEAEDLRRADGHQGMAGGNRLAGELNGRRLNRLLDFSTEFTERIFQIAAGHLSGDEILSRIHMWIQEDKLGALLRTVRGHLPLSVVSSDLRRYFFTTREDRDNRYPLARGLKVLLIECVLSSRLEYINVAKHHVEIEDLYHLIQKVIFSTKSHGKLGGKSAGLFLASQILKKTNGGTGSGSPFGIPKTWYIPSDMMLEFIHYNNMDEIIEQKYKDKGRVRLEYPHIIEMFQQTVLPRELANGLSTALDDFGGSPLVVRSSSLLEDRTGSGFVGKYKTVFLGNQGGREERLRDLASAVAEVYASNFGPDAIEYREDRGLLEFSEQMGVMIQEVVGTRVGQYFLPAYSGVARSRNDLHWLPDVAREDGAVRMIPGLGTRAADRMSEEYPVLVVPGRPSIQANRATEDGVRHAPKRLDVVNLETNRLQTIELSELMVKAGEEYPEAERILSARENGEIRPLDTKESMLDKKDLVVTFDGLITRSPFVAQIRSLMRTLEQELGAPVEIEFASDGERIYLLQCCPQATACPTQRVPIPKEIDKDKLVFSANRYISNGWVSNVTHIVYLCPAAYEALEEQEHRRAAGQAVARLNELLPKRQFVLMRPGRWIDRGDGRSTVALKYDDFKNAAVLVDILQPEDAKENISSTGVHFLQSLAESGICYLPVFPDDEATCFNERVLLRSHNVLSELLPEYAFLADVVRVIDVPAAWNGQVMHVLMNAELGEAVALLADPEQDIGSPEEGEAFEDGHPENYWRATGSQRVRSEERLPFWQHEEWNGRTSERYRLASPLQGRGIPTRGPRPLARGLEPLPGRSQLPSNGIQVRRTPGFPCHYRRRYRDEDELRRENQRGHGRGASVETQRD